jgi:ATP-dependent helicase/nuclease subunit B
MGFAGALLVCCCRAWSSSATLIWTRRWGHCSTPSGPATFPAADPTRRWLRLADILAQVEGPRAQGGAVRLRRAAEIAQSIDRLAVEGIAPEDLLSEDVLAIIGEQAEHWRQSTRAFLTVQAHWRAQLEAQGEVDPPVRRNMLFDRAALVWRDNPPPHAVVAAGITSASPSLARFLRVVAELPGGAVVLPDLDLALDDDVWDELGHAGVAPELGDAPFGREDALTHPQYHLKLLLNRMGVARGSLTCGIAPGRRRPRPNAARRSRTCSCPPRLRRAGSICQNGKGAWPPSA